MQLLKREFGENMMISGILKKKIYLFVFFNWLNCVKFQWYGREMCNVVENC